MDFVKRTIDLAMKNVEEGGRPFATVIVRDGEIVAESPNVAQTSDPTAHAEILAVRDACRKLGTEHLSDCEIYILAARARCASVRCTTAARSAWSTSRRARTTRRSTATTASISELDTFYAEYAKPIDERRLPMVQQKHGDAINVYRRWKELNAK